MHRVLCALGMENKRVVFIHRAREDESEHEDTNRCAPLGGFPGSGMKKILGREDV